MIQALTFNCVTNIFGAIALSFLTSLLYAGLFVFICVLIYTTISKSNTITHLAKLYIGSSTFGFFALFFVASLIGNINHAQKYKYEHTENYLTHHYVYVDIDDNDHSVTIHNEIGKSPVNLYLLTKTKRCKSSLSCAAIDKQIHVSSFYIVVPPGKENTSANIDLPRFDKHEEDTNSPEFSITEDKDKISLIYARDIDNPFHYNMDVRNHTDVPVYIHHHNSKGCSCTKDTNTIIKPHHENAAVEIFFQGPNNRNDEDDDD